MDEKFILNYVVSKTGEYATANKIYEVMGLSLSYIYAIVKNEKIRKKSKYNRAEYNVVDFLKVLNFASNNIIIEEKYSKEENYIDNFYNWQPKNDLEKFLESLLLDELGEFTSIKELVRLFKVSKTVWYEILDDGKIMEFYLSKRRVIVTRSLIPFLRENKFKEI